MNLPDLPALVTALGSDWNQLPLTDQYNWAVAVQKFGWHLAGVPMFLAYFAQTPKGKKGFPASVADLRDHWQRALETQALQVELTETQQLLVTQLEAAGVNRAEAMVVVLEDEPEVAIQLSALPYRDRGGIDNSSGWLLAAIRGRVTICSKPILDNFFSPRWKISMNQHSGVLFVVSPASQERLKAAAGSEIAFANSFTLKLAEHPWQILIVEDALWSEAEVLPFRNSGLSILAITNSPFASAEVFEFRQRGESPKIVHLADQLFSVARKDLSILILGETGAGKEIVAKTLHSLSERTGKMICVNCSALPADLAESLLFGHEKGAFSGAATRQPGFFEQAEGGTLFLDEVFELPEAIQAKLLRTLQEGTVVSLGGKEKKVNVRVVAATNRSPEQMMADGGLRQDFYYRFAKTIEVPPLRNRVADIPVLIGHFLSQAEHPLKVGEDIVALLKAYTWPGNVRELKALVEDWVSHIRAGDAVLIEDLPVAFHPSKQPSIPEFEDSRELTLQFGVNPTLLSPAAI